MTCLVTVFVIALSWGIVCLLWWLISLCFGFGFSWLTATGVWLAAMLIKFLLSD